MKAAPTQERIRDAATQLFAARGYGGTSIADIAEQAEISKAGLYNYYSSKEELLLELLERSFAAWRSASRPALEREGPCRERLHEHFLAAVQFTHQSPHEIAIVRIAATQIDGELGRRVDNAVADQRRGYTALLEGFFEEALRRGEVRNSSPQDLARTWRTFLDGLLTDMVFRARAQLPTRKGLEGIWTIIWRGLEGESS